MIRKLMLTALIALGVASAAHAATTSKATARHPAQRSGVVSLDYIGPRVGFSVDPDQAVVGGHLSATFAPDWTFNPSVEFGFGDHQTVSALNFDAEYHFRIQNSNWAPYVGGGLGVNFVHVDVPFPFSDFNDTVTGLNLIVGTSIPTASGQHLFTELRIGAGDSAIPELKGILGFNFKL
jgi:opacity protein-like surface antigen